MTRERERGREMNGEWLGEREREFVCSHYVSGCRFDGLFFK